MLTFGAYIAFTFDVTLDTPLVVGVLAGVLATAAFGIASELIMWRPMRKKKAGMLQLLLMSLGLAFVLRNMIQFIWGSPAPPARLGPHLDRRLVRGPDRPHDRHHRADWS